MKTEEDYDVQEIRKAEAWFESSRYGKGRIAGFVTILMVDYAKHYHEEQRKTECHCGGYPECICNLPKDNTLTAKDIDQRDAYYNRDKTLEHK
jgi:hypothetical protein